MKKTFTYFLAVALAISTGNAIAAQKPRGLASDHRIKVVAYDANNVVVVHAKMLTSTTIQFGQDESILNIQSGDQDAWSISPSKVLPYLLNVKPTMYGSNTDLMVATDKHIYYFQLISPPAPALEAAETKSVNGKYKVVKPTQPANADYTYAIRFSYPQEQRALWADKQAAQKQLQATQVSNVTSPTAWNWNYQYALSRELAPIQMFDNGQSTFMLFRPNAPIPAIFAVLDAAGHEALVNYRMSGNYVVIDRVARQFTLRNGSQVTSVFNAGYHL